MRNWLEFKQHENFVLITTRINGWLDADIIVKVNFITLFCALTRTMAFFDTQVAIAEPMNA